MSKTEKTILDKWQVSPEELSDVITSNPSLRGIILGYLAEVKLRKTWFDRPEITKCFKHDDHDRLRKGDLVITYKCKQFVIECKSLQTNTVRKNEAGAWTGKVQCDASDRRTVKLPNGKQIETTCLVVGEFDLLAVNLFAFENKWRFIFAKNNDLPRSQFKKYRPSEKKFLLSTLIDVTWPPVPPFRDEPFSLLDEMI
ncbi:MAG: restriction endonuclease [Sedimentisphaerales bacterium]